MHCPPQTEASQAGPLGGPRAARPAGDTGEVAGRSSGAQGTELSRQGQAQRVLAWHRTAGGEWGRDTEARRGRAPERRPWAVTSSSASGRQDPKTPEHQESRRRVGQRGSRPTLLFQREAHAFVLHV